MDPAWINPAPEKDIVGSSQKNERKDWSDYCKRILKAKRFHISLGGYYHPQSFIHYGGDENYSSFHRVQWKLMPTRYSKGQYRSGALPGIPTKSHALALSLVHDSFEGAVQVVNESVERGAPEKSSSAPEISGAGSNYLALLQGQDQAGDGTVPRHSAEDAAKAAIFSASMTGYEHQNSYKDDNVKSLTLYSILRLASSV